MSNNEKLDLVESIDSVNADSLNELSNGKGSDEDE